MELLAAPLGRGVLVGAGGGHQGDRLGGRRWLWPGLGSNAGEQRIGVDHLASRWEARASTKYQVASWMPWELLCCEGCSLGPKKRKGLRTFGSRESIQGWDG